MKLQLNNIGIIQKASIELNGLTVIAGENDTGKSTAGRAFYYAINGQLEKKVEEVVSKHTKKTNNENMAIGALIGFGLGLLTDTNPLAGAAIGGLGGAVKDSNQTSSDNDSLPAPKKIKNTLFDDGTTLVSNEKLVNTVMIETPYSLNNATYIKTTQLLAQQKGLNFTLGDHIIDLILQMSQTPNMNESDLYLKIQNIIDGKLYYDEKRDNFFYYKDSINKELEMNSTATGIKMFGFLQVLLLNNTIKKGTVLILDEPEVHLHPKWQLKYAELLIELVKNGVKVLVTSHSPYMIEALKRYSELLEIEDKTNFYLAEDGYIKQIDDSNSKTLVEIYEKLSEPYDVFEQMESDRFQNG